MVARCPRSGDDVFAVGRKELRVAPLGLADPPPLPFRLAGNILEFLLRRCHGRQNDSQLGRISGSVSPLIEEAIEQRCGLGLGAWNQVAVEVERDLDRGMAMKTESALGFTPAAIINEA